MNKKKILIVTECFYPEEFKINDIAISWKEKGFDIDRRKIQLSEPIKTLGDHTIEYKLHKEVTAKINVKITPEEVKELPSLNEGQETNPSKVKKEASKKKNG